MSFQTHERLLRRRAEPALSLLKVSSPEGAPLVTVFEYPNLFISHVVIPPHFADSSTIQSVSG
jgi:hypothetical protein